MENKRFRTALLVLLIGLMLAGIFAMGFRIGRRQTEKEQAASRGLGVHLGSTPTLHLHAA
ncbi:hypothetical protein LJY25_00075 [Hymenobacter sp. BT175]|uniref:hypothetical protein n=1 Tax=Hymenobacter translucens TaxID=2886507 RepID=UPI001D0E2E36|nr:hypothetical protein [Hymenobacter translucens]MCC2544825.1 hypothetical protein [Hymenobacter translucens]